MPDELQDLAAAVRELYHAFRNVARRAQLDFCDHCVSPEDAEALVRTPLHDISAGLLQAFVLNAVSETWGTGDDLCYYLPRILELLANGDLDSYDISGLFIAMGIRRPDWPHDQQDAVSRYLNALWRATAAGYWHPFTLNVLQVLEAAADLGFPVEHYLSEWSAFRSEPAALHLAWLIRNLPGPHEEWSRAIGRWMTGPDPALILTQALANASTPEIAANLSAALSSLNSPGRPAA
jgi:hypothetical protein